MKISTFSTFKTEWFPRKLFVEIRYVKSILRKLEIHSRVEAAVIAVEHGLKRKN